MYHQNHECELQEAPPHNRPEQWRHDLSCFCTECIPLFQCFRHHYILKSHLKCQHTCYFNIRFDLNDCILSEMRYNNKVTILALILSSEYTKHKIYQIIRNIKNITGQEYKIYLKWKIPDINVSIIIHSIWPLTAIFDWIPEVLTLWTSLFCLHVCVFSSSTQRSVHNVPAHLQHCVLSLRTDGWELNESCSCMKQQQQHHAGSSAALYVSGPPTATADAWKVSKTSNIL